VNNPFNLADEWSFSASDQRPRLAANASTRLPWGFQVATIFFAGSKRPINTRTTLDPFGSGAGRWLDAVGLTVARNSERTAKKDYKLDVAVENLHDAQPPAVPGDHRGVQHSEHLRALHREFGRSGNSTSHRAIKEIGETIFGSLISLICSENTPRCMDYAAFSIVTR
jgi:hypothetical protein